MGFVRRGAQLALTEFIPFDHNPLTQECVIRCLQPCSNSCLMCIIIRLHDVSTQLIILRKFVWILHAFSHKKLKFRAI